MLFIIPLLFSVYPILLCNFYSIEKYYFRKSEVSIFKDGNDKIIIEIIIIKKLELKDNIVAIDNKDNSIQIMQNMMNSKKFY